MWVVKVSPEKSLLRGYTHIEQLQRHIAVLFRWIALVFVVTHFQSLNEFIAGVTGHNHFINQAAFCRTIRVREFILVIFDYFLFFFRSGFPIEDIYSSRSSHNGYFRLWVSQVHIGSRRLAGHDNVGTSISFTGN